MSGSAIHRLWPLSLFALALVLVQVGPAVVVALGMNSGHLIWWQNIFLTLAWLSGAALCNQLIRRLLLDGLVAHAIGAPVPGILKSIVSLFVYLVATTGIVGLVYEHNVVAFLATLGASSLVLGFALRSLIADIFTGLAINIDRSFVIGDWVQVNEGVAGVVVGQIVEIGWRCTSLRTEAQTRIVIPNGQLGVERVINITRPEVITRYETSLTVDFTVAPQRVKRVLLASLLALEKEPGFDTGKQARVLVTDTTELGVEYLLRYWIRAWDPVSPSAARDQVLHSALTHLYTAGITLAYPKRDVFTARMPERQFDSHNREDLRAILRHGGLFGSLEPANLDLLVDHMQRRHLDASEVLVHQGDEGRSQFVLIEGLLEVLVDRNGHPEPVGRLYPGESFGELSLLTGERRSATVRALTEAVVYEIPREPVAELLVRRPDLADYLGQLLARRQMSTAAALSSAEDPHTEEAASGFARQLAARIREFIGFTHATPKGVKVQSGVDRR